MLPLISFVLGLAFLSGINLYLATFLAGLCLHLGWIDPAVLPLPAVLGHPAVLILAFVLFAVEFVVDKIPWVDSTWDAVHTLIRPAAAAGLSALILQGAAVGTGGTVAVAVVAGLLALSAHLTKSGVRLLINASPEPFTNILASLAEDLAVAGLLVVLVKAPVSGFATCLALLAGTWIALPRLFGLVKVSAYLLWKKVFSPASPGSSGGVGPLPCRVSLEQETLVSRLLGTDTAVVAWAVPGVTGSVKEVSGLRSNRFGTLVSCRDFPGSLFFVTKGWFRGRAFRVSLAGATVRQDRGTLSENLVILRPEDGLRLVLRFPHSEAPLVGLLVQDLQRRLGHSLPVEAGSAGSLSGGSAAEPSPFSRSGTMAGTPPLAH